jgi:APA family basic amino acid/polyamine antiporter
VAHDTNHPEEAGRVIGSAGALAIVVGSMLGIGIFLSPAQVATQLPSTWGYLAVWLVCGLIAFAGAVAYAELGTRFPRAGGDYVLLRHAFGPSLSFAAGWLLFVGVFAGSVATMAVPIGQFQAPVLLAPWLELSPDESLFSVSLFGITWLQLTQARAIGVALIVLLTVLNILGTRLSTAAQLVLTALPVLFFAAMALYIFAFVEPAAAPAQPPPVEEPVIAFGRALLAVYFAFAGWNAIAYVGGELRQPKRTIPLSLLGGTVLITLLYLLMAGAFLYVLGIDALPRAFEAGTATAQILGGGRAAFWVTALIALALLGSVNATILAGGRVGWAMALDDERGNVHDEAPRSWLAELHPRWGTPHRSLLLLAALAIVFVLTGSFQILLELTSVAMLLMSALTMLALFKLRRRDGDDAPYRATLYPYLPLLFLLVSIGVIAAQLYRALAGSDKLSVASFYPLMGLGVFGLSFGLHWLARRGSARIDSH